MTSPYTKVLNAPVFVTFNDAQTDTEQAEYQGGVKTIAYLLEGKFQSLYKNRLLPNDPKFANFKAESLPTKIIGCSDGDLIVNEVSQKTGNPLPLGYDKTTQHTFGNKDFVMNAIDYLLDEDGVIQAKGKEVKLRPLDKLRTRDERNFWQILNIGLPVALVLFFGFILQWARRRKYGFID
jgi:gliding-associated putative ABC transporter substrate-binding component GldG